MRGDIDMNSMLMEIGEEIQSSATTWRKELLDSAGDQPADLFVGDGPSWKVQVAVLGNARMGTAVSSKTLTLMKLTDELTELAESRAKAVLQ